MFQPGLSYPGASMGSADPHFSRHVWFGRVERWGHWMLEAAVVLAVAWVTARYRFLDLEEIEIGGDALKVWEFARQLAHGGGLPDRFNHHTARLGLVLPTLLTQLVFGSKATTYFIGPLVATTVLHVVVYLLGRVASGPVAGVLAVVLLWVFPPMQRASSQILPEAYGPMFACSALLFAMLFALATRKWTRLGLLLGTGLLIYGAYASKMVYLYYAPGCAFIVWWGAARQKNSLTGFANAAPTQGRFARMQQLIARFVGFIRRHALGPPLILTFAVIGLIAIEGLLFSLVSDDAHRIAVVTKSHKSGGAKVIKEAVDFLALYTNSGREWQPMLFLGFPALLGVLAFAAHGLARLFALSLLIYLLLQTFVLRSVFPPVPWMEPHPRYLLATAAPFAVVVGMFGNEVVARGIAPLLRNTPLWLRTAAPLALLAGLLVFVSQGPGIDWQKLEKGLGKRDGWHRTQSKAELFTEAFEKGIPITTRTRYGKALTAAGAVYISPEHVLDKGRLPSNPRYIGKTKGMQYLAKVAGKDVREEVIRRERARECVIMTAQRYRHMTVKSRMEPECPPLPAPLDARLRN